MEGKNFDTIPLEQFHLHEEAPARTEEFDTMQLNQPYSGKSIKDVINSQKFKKAQELRNSVEGGALGFLYRPQTGFIDAINKTVEASRLPAIAGGALQGSYDVAKSTANVIPGVNVPDINLKQYASPDAISQAAFGGGKLVPEIYAFSKGYDALSAIPKLGSRSAIATAIRGMIPGYVLGQDVPGGRKVGAALGGGGAFLAELPSKAIASKIVSRGKELKGTYKNLYDGFFSKLEDQGLRNIDNPSQFNISTLEKLPSGQVKNIGSLKKYIENPTLRNAHAAQSDLGGIQRETGRMLSLSSQEREAVNAVNRARKRVTGDAISQLVKSGRGELAGEYRGIQEGYRKEVVPYLNKYIKKYEKGQIGANHLVRNLPNQPDFYQTATKYHQDLLRHNLVKSAAEHLKTGAAYGLMSNLFGDAFEAAGLSHAHIPYQGNQE